jgi:predicted metalloprotease with PDZ domain
MKSSLGALCVLLLCVCVTHAQTVTYQIAFPNRAHHEAEVTAVFDEIERDGPLEIRMSRTSPGRYALHEFAKNVYSVRFYDGAGTPLTATRPNLHQWNVSRHDGTVRMTYTLFGDQTDGTYTGINSRYAHLNMPATFVWARGLEEAPVTISFDVPEPDWSIATQLYPAGRENEYHAPDFWYFMDSPTHIGRIGWRAWEVTELNAARYTIRLALDHDGTEAELDEYADRATKIVAEQIAMWQDVPDFETATYTFIATYLPWVDGDGMEHRNSTILTSNSSLKQAGYGQLSTLSHEFFHAWNVERMRPKSLEPFDFEAANMSAELWFAEGFTSYYDELFVRRAGITTNEQYAALLSVAVNAATNAPGRRFFSAAQMSMQAPFVDAATSVDPQNKANTFISYYTWGNAIALGLDLRLRRDFGITLDDYMRAMWARHGRTEVPYTIEDLQTVLGQVTGNPTFATDVFKRYILGHEVMDYPALLEQAGFHVRRTRPGKVWLGASFDDHPAGGALVTSEPLIGGPLYASGVGEGDRIVSIDGESVTGSSYMLALSSLATPGDSLTIQYLQAGEPKASALMLTEDPTIEVIPFERAGRQPTRAMRSFRSQWLGSLVQE